MGSWTIERPMTARIALFRAPEDAAGSAGRLRRLGFSVAHVPVIEIAPLPFAPAKTRYDAIVATSAKAFLSEAPVDRTSPLFVVGARTARAGKARGWRLAAPPAPDAERLIETLERLTEPGASVLYLAGRDRKDTLEAALGAKRALEVVEIYAAEARTAWRPAEARALSSCAFALHYSQRSAVLAARLAEAAGLSGRFAAMTHVCLSADVAGPLEAIGAAHVVVAERPDEPALLAALSRAAHLFPSDSPYRI
jgi:uroporphyrinogen-III synthase